MIAVSRFLWLVVFFVFGLFWKGGGRRKKEREGGENGLYAPTEHTQRRTCRGLLVQGGFP